MHLFSVPRFLLFWFLLAEVKTVLGGSFVSLTSVDEEAKLRDVQAERRIMASEMEESKLRMLGEEDQSLLLDNGNMATISTERIRLRRSVRNRERWICMLSLKAAWKRFR